MMLLVVKVPDFFGLSPKMLILQKQGRIWKELKNNFSFVLITFIIFLILKNFCFLNSYALFNPFSVHLFIITKFHNYCFFFCYFFLLYLRFFLGRLFSFHSLYSLLKIEIKTKYFKWSVSWISLTFFWWILFIVKIIYKKTKKLPNEYKIYI